MMLVPVYETLDPKPYSMYIYIYVGVAYIYIYIYLYKYKYIYIYTVRSEGFRAGKAYSTLQPLPQAQPGQP